MNNDINCLNILYIYIHIYIYIYIYIYITYYLSYVIVKFCILGPILKIRALNI